MMPLERTGCLQARLRGRPDGHRAPDRISGVAPVQKMTLRAFALLSFAVIISWASCITRALNTSFAQAWGATNGRYLFIFLTRTPTAVRLSSSSADRGMRRARRPVEGSTTGSSGSKGADAGRVL